MVWYVPPLSPVESLDEETIDPGADPDEVFGGDRGAAHPRRVPRELPLRRRSRAGAPVAAAAGGDAPLHARLEHPTARATRRSRPTSGWSPSRWRRCTGWSRSATTTTATCCRRRHGEVSPDAFAEQGSCGIDFVDGSRPTRPTRTSNIVRTSSARGDGRWALSRRAAEAGLAPAPVPDAERAAAAARAELAPRAAAPGERLARFADWWARDPGRRPPAPLRRDVRLHAPQQPAPHLPRPRRPPPARHGAAPPQAALRGRGPRAPRRRAARLPAGDARVRRARAARRRAGAARGARESRSSSSGRACTRTGSPYAPLLDAVADALPRLTGRRLARIRRLAAEGPPSEQVGLEPFAPPEVMPHGGAVRGELLLTWSCPTRRSPFSWSGTCGATGATSTAGRARSTQLLESRWLEVRQHALPLRRPRGDRRPRARDPHPALLDGTRSASTTTRTT